MIRRTKRLKHYELWWSDHYNMSCLGVAQKHPRATPDDAPDYKFVAEFTAKSWHRAKMLALRILDDWHKENK